MLASTTGVLRAGVIGLLAVSLLNDKTVNASPLTSRSSASSHNATHKVHRLFAPASGAVGASIAHRSSFASFSFEPAFWVEFFGNYSSPNALTFSLLDRIYERGGRPTIRPGGITMDSMIFDASAGDPVRDTSATGGVYRTTVGPEYYKSWSHFPPELKFVSTLNFGNDSLEIAQGLAEASIKYQPERIEYLELGNEPTNYPSSRWSNSTEAYVTQWKDWTTSIDAAVNQTLSQQQDGSKVELGGQQRWWASSATTDKSGLNVRPVDIIPAGIDSDNSVAEYSIHSYPFATCDPARAAIATLPNILNHTDLVRYADEEIMPSAKAALDSGRPWVIGEFNSIACSGQPNVTDTFAQALWVVDAELIYAVRNASSVHLHQGATLVFQSSQQVNSAGDDGKPGFSTYDFVYPIESGKRGEARALPSFVAQLFLAEAFSSPKKVEKMRVAELPKPEGVNGVRFAAYGFYDAQTGEMDKVALLNMEPFYNNSTKSSLKQEPGLTLDLSALIHHNGGQKKHQAVVKRMTAPKVDEKDTNKATWAGQSFTQGKAQGEMRTEKLAENGKIRVRDSEAVLIFLNSDSIYSA